MPLLSTYYVPVTGLSSKQTSFLLTWSSQLVIKMEGCVVSGCVATLDWGKGGNICQEHWMTRRNPPWKDGEQSILSRGSVSQCKVKYWETTWFPLALNPANLLSLQGAPQALLSKLSTNHLSLLQTITNFVISATNLGNVPAFPSLVSFLAVTTLQIGHGWYLFHSHTKTTHMDLMEGSTLKSMVNKISLNSLRVLNESTDKLM